LNLRLDALTAIATSTYPRFELYTMPNTESSWAIPSSLRGLSIDPSIVDFGSRLLSEEVSSILAPALMTNLTDLKRIVLFNEMCKDPTYDVAPSDLEFFSVQETAVEHELLAYPALTTAQWGSYSSVMTECCRLAALIYALTALWVFESNSAMLRGPVVRLQQTLLQGMDSLLDPRRVAYSDVLLWVLFIGSHAAAGQVERAWFVAEIARPATRLGLRGWEDVRRCLRGLLYIDRAYQAPFEAIWDESQVTQV
jgi:hypothetical protein